MDLKRLFGRPTKTEISEDDRLFLERALDLEYPMIPPMQDVSELRAQVMQLRRASKKLQRDVSELPAPKDHRLRKVHRMLLRGADKWSAIIGDLDLASKGEFRFLGRAGKNLSAWKRDTDRARKLLREYATDMIGIAERQGT